MAIVQRAIDHIPASVKQIRLAAGKQGVVSDRLFLAIHIKIGNSRHIADCADDNVPGEACKCVLARHDSGITDFAAVHGVVYKLSIYRQAPVQRDSGGIILLTVHFADGFRDHRYTISQRDAYRRLSTLLVGTGGHVVSTHATSSRSSVVVAGERPPRFTSDDGAHISNALYRAGIEVIREYAIRMSCNAAKK